MARAGGSHDLVVRAFGRLGRGVVRHPWYPIVFWVVLFVVTVPFLPLLGKVTTNSTTTIASSAPSQVAQAKFDELFPNATGGSSSTLVFYGSNLTDALAQRVIQGVTAALVADRSLAAVGAVESVYTQYSAYLAGQARLAAGAIAAAQASSPSLLTAVNASAAVLWGPPAEYVAAWLQRTANSSAPASDANYPAYRSVAANWSNSSAGLDVLDAFYAGAGTSNAGFNGSADCAAAPAAVVACAVDAVRANVEPILPTIASALPVGAAGGAVLLGNLDLTNYTAWPSVRAGAATVLSPSAGLPAGWLDRVWAEFGAAEVPAPQAAAWANATVANATYWTEPLPVPYAISAAFVSPTGGAQLIQVSFTVADDATNASGGDPVYSDLPKIDAVASATLTATDPTGSIAYLQTGPAPLDQLSTTAVNASLALVLPLTVGLLLVIAMLYFRSPVTPLVTFAGLAIALILGLGGTVLIGTLITKVDTTSLTLVEVFVLGVGTDYSIFLAARYREELVAGRSSDDAIVAAVSWAGQSVATSGSTAIIATLALAFSGIALLSEWGMVLSLGVFITLLLSLTLLPAFLKLLGPRVFWPYTGPRFRRQAERVAAREAEGRTYFHRVGARTQRRPAAVVGAIVLVSVPLIAIALTVPLAYDYYGQLPSGHPATDGLNQLNAAFGPGFSTPSYALVTFASPLVVANQTNATEFTDVASLTTLAQTTAGIAAVMSPVGPYGASLSDWLAYGTLPSAQRTNLAGVLGGFVGTDGRTVVLDLQPTATGLSLAAVQAVQAVESSFAGFTSDHPEVTSVVYGGGAPTIHDLASQTESATNFMILAVTIGLLVVLLVVLRSWIIAAMAILTIGLSISWAWALSYLVFQQLLGFPLFFFVRTILFILILGLGIDYNIFLLTRVREERVKGRTSGDAAREAVAKTGGIITAAAVILASAFGALLVGEFTLIRAIGFSVAVAVVLDAMVVRTYLVPASLQILGERVWSLSGRKPRAPVGTEPAAAVPAPSEPGSTS